MNNYWKTAEYPSLEITTSIPKNGCVIDCVFCPQRVLQKVWNSRKFEDNRYLSLDNFKKCISTVPEEITIIFSGFTEPWLNRDTTKMLLHAHEKGHPIAVFTTGVGMSLEDVNLIKDIPFSGGPNRNFTLHLPDKEGNAKHPINKKYLEVITALKAVNLQSFQLMAMAEIHPDVEPIYGDSYVHLPQMWHRAGNLIGEAQLRPEVKQKLKQVQSIKHFESKTCGCVEHLYHNILLPNGEVSLCCMDYNLDEILGNLLTDNYDNILPKPQTTFNICMNCENAATPQSIIDKESEIDEYIKKHLLKDDSLSLTLTKENCKHNLYKRNVDVLKVDSISKKDISSVEKIIKYNFYPSVVAKLENINIILDTLKTLDYNFFKLKDSEYYVAKRDKSLNRLIDYYINNPDDQYNKFWLGYQYEKIGHASSGMGYYLSCAENAEEDNLLAYESLIRLALGYQMIGGRSAHLKNALQLAVSLLPERPEGYWLLSQHYYDTNDSRDEDKWTQMYMWACTAKNIAKKFDGPSLLTDIGYEGAYVLDFQKYVAAWWIGRFDESLNGFKNLKETFGVSEYYKNLIEKNLSELSKETIKWNT